jgi:hypothetical protein
VIITHTDDFRVAGDNAADVDYVVESFHEKFKITPVTTSVMLGVEVSAGIDTNGIRYVELTQTDYIERMYAEVSRFFKEGYKDTCPIPKDKTKSLVSAKPDGTILKPPVEEYAKNLDEGYRTIIGMLLWVLVQRNTNVDISTIIVWRIFVALCDIAFECMMQVVQWVYQERFARLKFTIDTSSSSIVPHVWYDASNDRDIQDSLCIGGTLTLMEGASVSYHANELRRVGSAGYFENEYTELERAARRIMSLHVATQYGDRDADV